MSRLSYEQLNIIKDKFDVSRLWSFSKVSTFTQCSWLYYLKYILKIRVDSDSCYTWWGTVSHDIIQGYYDGDYPYEEMSKRLEDKILEYNLLDDPKLKFPEQSQFDNYIENLRHYYKNVKPIPFKVVNEKAVLARFDGIEPYIFQGYIDSTYLDENENTVILDYKTSSISGFSGAKLIEKSRQLMIYAMGLNQFLNIPLEKIRIRYDMQKYLIVSYLLKNGNVKETKAERRLWVAKISNPLRKDLEDVSKELEKLNKEATKLEKKANAKKTTDDVKLEIETRLKEIDQEAEALSHYLYDAIEINEKIEEAINNNNLDNMPQFIKDKYTVTDCYIDVELNQEILDEFKKDLVATLDEIVLKEQEDNKEQAFNRCRIDEKDSFYCTNLCDMKSECKFYKEYKEHQGMFMDKKDAPSDAELLALLGL